MEVPVAVAVVVAVAWAHRVNWWGFSRGGLGPTGRTEGGGGSRGREERAASPTGKTVEKTAKDQQKEPKTKASLWEKERN